MSALAKSLSEPVMRVLRTSAIALAAFLLLGAVTATAADTKAQEKAALTAIQSWLKLVDAGKYSGSWQEAATPFQNAIKQDQWVQGIAHIRSPLGKVVSRKVISSGYMSNPPGAPHGEYVRVEFETTFAQKKGAIETAAAMMDTDKKWRVSGYYIK